MLHYIAKAQGASRNKTLMDNIYANVHINYI